MKAKNTLSFILFGISGALIGFVYGQGTRRQADSAVKTSFNNGIATVQLDTVKLARGGLDDLIEKYT